MKKPNFSITNILARQVIIFFLLEILISGVSRDQLVSLSFKSVSRATNQCWGTGDQLVCLMFSSQLVELALDPSGVGNQLVWLMFRWDR